MTNDNATAYTSNWEHIADELRRLDKLIHKAILYQQNRNTASLNQNFLDQFRGVALTDEEVTGLIADSDWRDLSEEPLETDSGAVRVLRDEIERLGESIQRRRAVSLKPSLFLSLPLLARLFDLTAFEEQCLLICLAPEIHRKYEKLYAYLQDDITRKRPSVALALDLLCRSGQEKLAARAAFCTQAPLLKYRLIHMGDEEDASAPLLSRFLKLDDRIVNFLLGHSHLDARLEPFTRLVFPQKESDATFKPELLDRTRDFVITHFDEGDSAKRNVVFSLWGPYGVGKRALAEAVSHDLGLPLLVADVERMKEGGRSFEDAACLSGREALLRPAVLCFESLDCLLDEPDKHRSQLKVLLEAARMFSRLTFFISDRDWHPSSLLRGEVFIPLELRCGDEIAGGKFWKAQSLDRFRFAENVDWKALAGKFRFSPGQIRDALNAAESLALWRAPEEVVITMDDLHAACRAQSTPKLDALARRITPKYKWDDIILPDNEIAQLRELCEQARHRQTVYGEWGFARKLSRGRGLNALFSGPPGTGKTMAAEVIATELQLDLYQIDLSQVVSKYIGETEKNLHRIFQEAQSSSAILFFDEADALFGKRSEVKDAHDRYANIEVGYLLQKMEEYEGIAILATNLRHHLDDAFVRRMQFIVEFPFPDEERRRRIWQVTFPREAPLSGDVDFGLLARDVKLAGGNIKNIGLAAAFYAASDCGVIDMSHLFQAARREFQKMGRTWGEPQ
ncbi:MAG TPA: ATP-binding protein [Blastocatellia bacterium]|nr:ATP-binding protein [Blastocatellia bacterium]